MCKATPATQCPMWEGRQKLQPRFSPGKGHARAWRLRHNHTHNAAQVSGLARATRLNDCGHMAEGLSVDGTQNDEQ